MGSGEGSDFLGSVLMLTSYLSQVQPLAVMGARMKQVWTGLKGGWEKRDQKATS